MMMPIVIEVVHSYEDELFCAVIKVAENMDYVGIRILLDCLIESKLNFTIRPLMRYEEHP